MVMKLIDIISKWAQQLIVALIITTILEMLLPNNKIKKYVKTIIGIYIVFCIISPFVDADDVFSFESIQKELENSNSITKIEKSDTQSNIEELYIEQFEKDVINRVEKLGYNVNKCEVDIEIDATKENAGINQINLNISLKKEGENDIKTENIKIENIQEVEISINDDEKENNTNITNNNTNDGQRKETENTKKIKKKLSEYYEIDENKINVTED